MSVRNTGEEDCIGKIIVDHVVSTQFPFTRLTYPDPVVRVGGQLSPFSVDCDSISGEVPIPNPPLSYFTPFSADLSSEPCLSKPQTPKSVYLRSLTDTTGCLANPHLASFSNY